MNMKLSTITHDYPVFLTEIKGRIRRAQYLALQAANKELLALYWDIGESIYQKQETLGWGKSVVQTLAADLQAEFPGRNGFSAPTLWFMRQFYAEYREKPILQSLIREISWTKNLAIMGRCKKATRDQATAYPRPRSTPNHLGVLA